MESSCENVLHPASINDERRRSEGLVAEASAAAPSSSAKTDIAALVLSALLLGGSSFPLGSSGGSAHAAGTATRPLVDPTKQAALIADLEDRLVNMKPVEKTSQPDPPRIEASNPKALEYAASKAARQQAVKIRGLPTPPPYGDRPAPAAPASSTTAAVVADTTPASGTTAATEPAVEGGDMQAPEVVMMPPAVSTLQQPLAGGGGGGNVDTDTIDRASSLAEKINSKMSGGKEFVKFQEHTFTVTLPEFNLPAVAPITVPEEGSWLPSSEFSRVEPSPSLVPYGDVIKDVLTKAASQGGVLKSRVMDMKPKQTEVNR